uniref:ATP synthase subunit a n=1 Tax=Starmerella bacillaris TaxID=1247836 RepID=Q6ED56_STABA|nr:ATP synthase F0 subunit 6 [Starmerella bacillaris]AAR10340.2 ATP synthase F0 subunit 6 [Starmerella bacillaris]
MLFMNSPLEQFEINNFVNNLSFLKFTTFSLYCMLVLGVYYMFNMYVFKSGKLISTNYNMFIEALYSTMLNMVKSQMGNKGNKYFPLMYSLFMFMLFSNLISMIPYNFAINAQLMFTISLSMTIWMGLTMLGLIKHKFEYFGLFMPSGTSLPLVPFLVMIEMISNIARSISLGLRLGANMLSGHLLLTILCGLMFDFIMSSSFIIAILGFIPLIMILGIVSLEFAMAAKQAYVFCVLTCSYIKDAIYLH